MIKKSDVKKEFNLLSNEIEDQFKERSVTKADIKEAVKWARRSS